MLKTERMGNHKAAITFQIPDIILEAHQQQIKPI
jgi:hypothetical protein